MTDRAMNYLFITNDPAGVKIQTYDGAGAGYVTHATGLAWDTWRTVTCEMTYDPVADEDTWVTTIDAYSSSPAPGYFNDWRKSSGFSVVPAARVRFTCKNANYQTSNLGFIIDDFSSESWESSDKAGTSSSYSTTFE
jgi:hypothetical protein